MEGRKSVSPHFPAKTVDQGIDPTIVAEHGQDRCGDAFRILARTVGDRSGEAPMDVPAVPADRETIDRLFGRPLSRGACKPILKLTAYDHRRTPKTARQNAAVIAVAISGLCKILVKRRL